MIVDNMKISIITATWNSDATVRDTIASIMSQSYQDWEHIIVDGGSTDNTLAIVHELESKYGGRLLLITGKDNGIYDAMNKGLHAATGDVVGILNSDDYYADDSILSLIAHNIDGVDAVYGNLDFVDAKNTECVVRRWIGSQHQKGCFLKGWHPAHPTFYVRRRLFEQYGGFDTSFDVSADFELMLRLLERHEVTSRYIDHTMVKMRMGGESTGSIRRIVKGNKNVIRAFKKNGFQVPRFYTVRRLAPKAFNMIKTKLGI